MPPAQKSRSSVQKYPVFARVWSHSSSVFDIQVYVILDSYCHTTVKATRRSKYEHTCVGIRQFWRNLFWNSSMFRPIGVAVRGEAFRNNAKQSARPFGTSWAGPPPLDQGCSITFPLQQICYVWPWIACCDITFWHNLLSCNGACRQRTLCQ